MESTPWSTAVPLMPAVIAHDESATDVLDRPGRWEAASRHWGRRAYFATLIFTTVSGYSG